MSGDHRGAGRREALSRIGKASGAAAMIGTAAFWLSRRSVYPGIPGAPALTRNVSTAPRADLPEIVTVQGGEPARLVRRAVEELGGIRRFIARGDIVAVKPNVSWDRSPEQAANTNPDVLAETARLCLEAGARKVLIADVTIHDARRCYERSGIAEAIRNTGAEIVWPAPQLLKTVDLRGETLRAWPVFTPFLEADKVINVPVAKHHSLTRVTLGIKNWYGILGGTRQRLHQRIHESLADLASFLRPTLTILDAYRVLARGGPSGGSLDDVRLAGTLIAGSDPVAVDARAAEMFWGLKAGDLPYLQLASKRGLGTADLSRVRARAVKL